MKEQEQIRVLKEIVKRWNKTQEIQKKNPQHYKLYKKTIDAQDVEINAISSAITKLTELEKENESLKVGLDWQKEALEHTQKELDSWKHELAYYTKEEVATPKGVKAFFDENVDKSPNQRK